jgi:hypothetical protein
MLTHILWSVGGQHRNLSCMAWKSTYYLSLIWSRFTWLDVYMAALCEWQSLWYILIGVMDFNTGGVYEREWLWHIFRELTIVTYLWVSPVKYYDQITQSSSMAVNWYNFDQKVWTSMLNRWSLAHCRNRWNQSKIWGSHSGYYEAYYLQGSHTAYVVW